MGLKMSPSRGKLPAGHPVRIVALDHVVLRIADLDRSVVFYRDVLGCTVEKWQAELGLMQLRAGSALIDLVTLEGPLGREGGAGPGRGARNLDHFCLRLEGFDDALLRAHLAAHGVEAGATSERYGAEGCGPSLYIRDPDGNTVELKAPPSE